MRIYLLFVAGLLAIAGIRIYARPSVATGSVENPTCEQIGPNTYRIAFQPTAHTGAVEVFASSRPDRIDSEKPVGILRAATGNISLPERVGRVYFHLIASFLNLTNEVFGFYQGSEIYPIQREYYGTTYSFGMRWTPSFAK